MARNGSFQLLPAVLGCCSCLELPALSHSQQQERTPPSMPRWLALLLAFHVLQNGSLSLFSLAGVLGAEGNPAVSSRALTGNQGRTFSASNQTAVLASLQDFLVYVIWGKSFPSNPPPWVQMTNSPLRSL